MRWFETYCSNTVAGSGNQLFFCEKNPKTGRVFYRIEKEGEYAYSLLFSNTMDSTYADGSISHANLICGQWKIHEAKILRVKHIDWQGEALCPTLREESAVKLTFGGSEDKWVAPGEFFSSDPVKMHFEKGEYLCLEMTFSGNRIPYHEESLLPVFSWDGGEWRYDKRMPFAGMIGCDRRAEGRIAFFGDSITQGIGTEPNSYAHWNAVAAEKLGAQYAYWNLGIGYGRAHDAASDGAWMYKAKHNDWVVVCFGVNDILKGMKEEQIKSDLADIVRCLGKAGVRVLLQTVPPFDYQGEQIGIWTRINEYIRAELSKEVDAMFDAAMLLAQSADEPHKAKYGGHPDAQGCRVWGEALAPVLRSLLEEEINTSVSEG